MDKNRIFHVISNTHWDREWRYSFQKNRQMLVDMIDRLLEILDEQPEYRAFHLDSQTIVLRDYLEIRPERKQLISDHIRDGRILVGPWYILPDEFQVGGENLIRNLLKGHRIARRFGHVMKVGYSPFSWGQISQLPQIYRGFGIDVVMFYRGVNSLDSEKAEFIWSGADGTQVLASRFSTMPRYNFYFYIYRPVVHDEQIPDIEYKWAKGGTAFHFSDPELVSEDYSLLKPLDEYHAENLPPAVDAIIDKQVNDFTTKNIFWAEGHDSSGPSAATVRIIRDANAYLKSDKVVHSTLEEYAEAIRLSVDWQQLTVVKGERRSSQFDRRSGNLYGYTTSARMDLKLRNFQTEKWLQFYAEPFYHMAGLLGMDTEDRYLSIAWDLLLQNSSHDSIGGCSLDEIHDDMINRYKQCQEISRGVFARACHHIASKLNLPMTDKNDIHLIALNPNTHDRSQIVEAYIDIPSEIDLGSLSITDMHNRPVEVQIINCTTVEPVLEQMTDRPMMLKMQRYHCFLDLRELSAMGIRTYRVKPVEKKDTKTDLIAQLAGDSIFMENKYLRVQISPNGSLDILSKANNREYTGQAWFADEGEAGHAWTHESVGPVFDTLDSKPDMDIVMNGPLMSRCRVRHSLALPGNLKDRKAGKCNSIVPIILDVSLAKNGQRVELDVYIDNRVEDHRIRLMFPLGLGAKSSFGEGQFDVVERSVDRPDTKDWIEQPMYDFPMHQFVDVSSTERGAAFFTGGLKEYELLDDPDQTLAITLLRAFSYVIQPSSVQDFSHKKGSQCPGKHHFRTAFYAHAGDWLQGQVYRQALDFHHPVRTMQVGHTSGDLNPDISFMRIEPQDLVFSCFKDADDGNGYILRFYNPTANEVNGTISFFKRVETACHTTLEEIDGPPLEIAGQSIIPVEIAGKKIQSLRIIFESEGSVS